MFLPQINRVVGVSVISLRVCMSWLNLYAARNFSASISHPPVHFSISSFTQTWCTWPMLNIILSHLHSRFLVCTNYRHLFLKTSFSSLSKVHTYRLSTEMAQEDIGLFLSSFILLIKELVEDPFNHWVRGNAFQSQALSCSPAVHTITWPVGWKKISSECFLLERTFELIAMTANYLIKWDTFQCPTESRNPLPYFIHTLKF